MEARKKFQQQQRKSQRNSLGENSSVILSPKGEGSHLPALKKYALWLFGKKSYTEHELFEKLKLKCLRLGMNGGFEALCSEVVESCKRLGLVNDEKILENYLEFNLPNRPMGRFAFLQRMHRRGIPFERAKEQWQSRKIDEHALARSVAEKRLVHLEGAPTVVQRQKLMQFLAGRGFAPNIVYEIADSLCR